MRHILRCCNASCDLKDLYEVTSVLTMVFSVERPTELRLKATGYDYVIWAGHAVTVYNRRTHA